MLHKVFPTPLWKIWASKFWFSCYILVKLFKDHISLLNTVKFSPLCWNNGLPLSLTSGLLCFICIDGICCSWTIIFAFIEDARYNVKRIHISYTHEKLLSKIWLIKYLSCGLRDQYIRHAIFQNFCSLFTALLAYSLPDGPRVWSVPLCILFLVII